MSKKVKLKDIAEKLGVSQNTVSLVLREMPGVSPETRQLILQTAKELGYVAAKKVMEMKNICIVSTVDTSTDTYFYTHVQQVIEEKLKANGYNLLVLNNIENYSKDQLISLFKSTQSSGIIILGDIDVNLGIKLVNCNLPMVGVGFYFKGIFIDTIIEDNISGVFKCVHYLKEKGYKKIGFIGNINSPMSFTERWIAYLGALKQNNLEINNDYMYTDFNFDQNLDPAFIAEQFKSRDILPEAFICANDKIAMVTMKALHLLGYSIPNDIGIVGFDYSELAKYSIPSITSVNTYREYQGIRTVQRILDKIKDRKSQTERIVIPVDLVEGESTRDIRKSKTQEAK